MADNRYELYAMKEIHTLLEKLYAYRDYALSRRFFPFVAASSLVIIAAAIGIGDIAPAPYLKPLALLISLMLIGLLWVSAACLLPHEKRWLKHARQMLHDCDHEAAERILATPPRFLGFKARIQRQEYLYSLKIETGDLSAAHALLLAAEQETLLPTERLSLQLARANLMYQAGNYTAFSMTLSKLDTGMPVLGLLRFKHALLKSHDLELKGEYSQAKAVLESAIEMTTEQTDVAPALCNLARLEDMQGNDTNAQSYYERAWQILCSHPMPWLYPRIGHNLLLKYAKNGAIQKATRLLNEYRTMVAPSNTLQQLQFLNDQLHLARQLDHRPMLLDSYKEVERLLISLRDKSQRLALVVSGLRMRLNDSMPVADHLTEAAALINGNHDLPTKERFQALSELLSVLQQCNAQVDGRNFRNMEEQVIHELLAMESEIDTQLHATSPVLSSIRDMWFAHKLSLCKLKIHLSAPNFLRSDFDNIFDLLRQRQRTWTDRGNPAGEIDALITLCDEFSAYARQLPSQFATDYGTLAQQALAEASEILERHWPHPAVHRQALGIAYFHWKLADDRVNAERWVLRFEKLKLNPAHHAEWFRQWHADVRGWLASLDQGATGSINTPLKTTAANPAPDNKQLFGMPEQFPR